jgi:TolA-binding protein
MMAKLLRSCLAVTSAVIFILAAYLQDNTSVRYGVQRPDPNTASIEGRVTLPSGRSADLNIKITLSNSQSMLTTFFTNRHGEFRFPNLSEGTYYVRAEGDANIYEPVTETVRLARGQITHMTITLRRREEIVSRATGPMVVTAAEFDQQVPTVARKEYSAAVKLIAKGRRQEAIAHLKQAIVIYPDFFIARNDLGAQHLKLKQLDEAAEQFRLVLEKHPKYFNSIFNLGLVMIERKNYAEAINQLNRAIAIDSARPGARLWLGVALLEMNDLPGAERELSKALITGGGEFAVAHYYLAQLYLRRGDVTEAMRALKAYLEEAPRGEYAEQSRLLLKKIAAEK